MTSGKRQESEYATRCDNADSDDGGGDDSATRTQWKHVASLLTAPKHVFETKNLVYDKSHINVTLSHDISPLLLVVASLPT